MFRIKNVVCALLIVILLAPPTVQAVSTEPNERPADAPKLAPALSEPLGALPFDVNAPSVLLCEADTGQVIFEKNATEKRPVASITKLMTLLLTFEAVEDGRLTLETPVLASKNAAGMGGSQALLDAGAEYPAGDLIKSVIVASANDAAVALAELTYGSEEAFVKRMNGRAAELGLTDTVYRNCTGLTAEGQYTTARDIARLTMVVLQYPLFFEYSGIWMDELTHPSGRKTELVNTNRMIRTYKGADGAKTGSTSEAMFCVSASATRDGMRLIAVVLGASSSAERFSAATKMLDYGFDHYYLTEVVPKGAVVYPELPVKGASVNSVDIVASDGLRAMIMKGEEAQIAFETVLPESLTAPVAAGDPVGEIIVTKDGAEIRRIPATIAEDIDEAGFFGSILRVIRAWFE